MKNYRLAIRQSGFSLIELLISLVIGLIILLGLVVVYVGAVRAHTTNTALAQVQENGRFAIHFLSHSIRMAGGTGCSGRDSVEVAFHGDSPERENGASIPWWADMDKYAIRGATYDRDGSNNDNFLSNDTLLRNSSHSPVEGSDVIVVLGAGEQNFNVTDVSNLGNSFRFRTDSHDSVASDSNVLIACDASESVILQCPGTGGSAITCGNDVAVDHNFYKNTTKLSDYEPYVFYIGTTNHGTGKALFRQQLMNTTMGAPLELVPDVVAMDIRYGVQVYADIQHPVIRYRTASQINRHDAITVNNQNFIPNWNDVKAVRIRLLVADATANVLDTPSSAVATQDFSYLDSDSEKLFGKSLTLNADELRDGRLRRVFVTTIAIRNRLP